MFLLDLFHGKSKSTIINPTLRIVTNGLLVGIFVTMLLWLQVADPVVESLLLGGVGLICLSSIIWSRRDVFRPRWTILLAVFVAVTLAYLFPELFGPVCGQTPRVFALKGCTKECTINVCTHWVDKNDPRCTEPGPGGGCCLSYTDQCDPNCEPPPPPTQPPTIDGILACASWGNNQWCVGNATLELHATEPQGKEVLISGEINGTPFACPVENGSISCSVPLPDGIGTINYTALSMTGKSASGSTDYKLDTTSPQLDGSLNGSSGANFWFVSSVDISVSALDTLSGLKTLETSLNNGVWTTYTAPLKLGDGEHIVGLRATDYAGNVAETTQTVKVDTLTPTLNLALSGLSGANGWYVSTIETGISASDSGSGLSNLEYDLDGAGWKIYTSPIKIFDGVHNLNLRAIDNAGNLTSGTQTFQVDTVAPELIVSINGNEGSNGWYTTTLEVKVLGSDVNSGLGLMEIKVDGGNWVTYTTPLHFSDGTHTYQFRATDNAGNVTLTNLQKAWVDTKAPVISLPESWELGDKTNFKLQDDGSGLSNVRIIIEDENERFPKISWEEDLNGYKFSGIIDWNGRFKDKTLAPPDGEYYAIVKVIDWAGNEQVRTGQIIVPLMKHQKDSIHPTETQQDVLISEGKITDPVVIPSIYQDNLLEQTRQDFTEGTPPEIRFGGVSNNIQLSNSQTGKLSFNVGGTSNASTHSNQSNILWGAAATAALGAFAVEIARRKEARKAALIRRRKMKQQAMAYYQNLKAQLDFTRRFQALREFSLVRKEKLLELKDIPKMKSSYSVPDMSWKKDDYAQLIFAQELAASSKPQQEELWWERGLNWIDKHQKGTSIGVGVTVGLSAVAIALLATSAVITLPVILAIAGSAAIISGVTVAIGTAHLNNYYDREIFSNLWSNVGAAVATTAVTAGLGLFVLGGGLTSALTVVGNGVSALCVNKQTLCSNIEPIVNGIDLAEESWLGTKLAYQTWRGDSAGAAETAFELQTEHLDGGMPGNAVAKELGQETIDLLSRYGDDAVELISMYGDEVVPLLLVHGDDAIEIIGAYGNEGIALLQKFGDNPDDAISLVKEFGTPAVRILQTVDITSAAKILNSLDDDVLDYAIKQGSDAVSALSYWPDKFLLTYGEELVLRAKQDARALKAAQRIVQIDNLNSQEAKELLDIIAYNSIQNSSERLVLGKWVSGTLDEGFIGVARADGALYYGTNPGIEKIFQDAKNNDPEALYWAVNNRVIEIAIEQDMIIDYSLSGLSARDIPLEIAAIQAIESGKKRDEVSQMFRDKNFPFRMREIEVLVAHGYGFTVDELNNILHWSKP